jgi:tetratricopeptide (TPR) repeat protein
MLGVAPQALADEVAQTQQAPPLIEIPESPGAHPASAALDARRQVNEELFDSLIKFNFDRWNEIAARGILMADARLRSTLEKSGADAEAVLARESKALRSRLEDAASRAPANEASLDAALRLASLLLRDDPRSVEAGRLLDQVVASEPSVRMSARRQWSGRLLRAHRALATQSFPSARADFSAVVAAAERTGESSSEHALRARIGLGDADFAEFLFTRAEGHYVEALRGLQRAALADHAALEPLAAGLHVRLVWSSFRSGRSFSTVVYATDYARRRSAFLTRPPEAVEAELVRASGIAFHERADRVADGSLADDARAGDFGKRILLASLNEDIRGGAFARGEARARALEKAFMASATAFDYFDIRATLAENSARARDAADRARAEADFLALRLARADGPWLRAFGGGRAGRDRRMAAVLKLGERTGTYFASVGRARGRREDHLKAHIAFRSRLEVFQEGEPRASLLLQSADAAFRGGLHEDAWQDARSAFRHGLSDDSSRQAFLLLARVSEAQATGSLSPSDPFFNRHLGAVDSFAAEHPENAEARQFLFASGAKLERLGFLGEALARYDRAFALVPRTSATRLELENVMRGLLTFHMVHSEPARAARALSALESVARESDLDASLRLEVELASAAQARIHAAALRRQGRLEDAASVQRYWSARHPTNPESPLLLRDAIVALHEAGEWKEALKSIEEFLRRHERHSHAWEVLALRGQVQEAQLAFQSAAVSFVAAAFDDASRLPLTERIALLERASDLLAQGGDERQAAGLRRKLAELRGASDPRGAAVELWTAATLFARVADHREAAGAFERAALAFEALGRDAPSARQGRMARLSAVESNARWRDLSSADLRIAERAIEAWPRGARERSEVRDDGYAQAVARVMELGHARIEQLAMDGLDARSRSSALPEALTILSRLELLAGRGRSVQNERVSGDGGSPSRKASPHADFALARALGSTAEIASGRDPATAQRLRDKARSLYFAAYLNAGKGTDLRAEAALALRDFTTVTTGDLPETSPRAPDDGAGSAGGSQTAGGITASGAREDQL